MSAPDARATPGLTIAVFCKPPIAGEVKTRLAASIGPVAAAELARAFFLDTWALLGALGLERVLATTTPGAAAQLGVPDATVWLQGEGSLAERLDRIFARGLEEGRALIALGADSPGLPAALLTAAASALHRHDAVVGPAEDGGFYLVGLRTPVPGLFGAVELSTAAAGETLRAELTRRQCSTALTEPWFDVDDATDLARLRALLTNSPDRAPHTARALRAIG